MESPNSNNVPERAQSTALITRAAIQPASSLPQRDEWQTMVAMANALAKAQGFIPKHFLENPHTAAHKVLAAIMYGRDLGFSPTQSLGHIFVIDGKPSLDAQAMGMLIRRAGHRLTHEFTGEGPTLACTVKLVRSDDGTEHVGQFSMKDAAQAQLTGKDPWKKYPRAMCYARAIGEVARYGAQDALMGVVYTAEELGAEVDEQARPIQPAMLPSGPAPTEVAFAELPTTGEIAPEAATAASREIIDAAARTAEVIERHVPDLGDEAVRVLREHAAERAAGAAPAPARARRGVGPTAKRNNVVTMPPPVVASDPAPATEPAREVGPSPHEPSESENPSPVSEDSTGAATFPATPEAMFGEPEDDLAGWRILVREQAAKLWVARVKAANVKRALEGRPLATEPPSEPNEAADAALATYISTQLPGKTLATLGQGDLENVLEALAELVARMQDSDV